MHACITSCVAVSSDQLTKQKPHGIGPVTGLVKQSA